MAETASGAPNRTVFRAFMRRTVAHLAAEGTRQFLHVGTGIPTKPSLHEVVQDIGPDAPIVYADNDRASRVVHTRAGPVGLLEASAGVLRASPGAPQSTGRQEARRSCGAPQLVHVTIGMADSEFEQRRRAGPWPRPTCSVSAGG